MKWRCLKSQNGLHNFVIAGGDCLDCGINQKELSKPFQKISKPAKLSEQKPQKGIHSFEHEKVKEVCDYFGDKHYKDFGRWIGILFRIGISNFEVQFRYVKEKGIKNPKYLMACFRKKK